MSTRMKVVSGIVWGLVALIAIGIWLLPPHIPVSDKVQGADRDMAVKAAALLLEKCPRLKDYWADFEKTEAEIVPDYYAKNSGADVTRGWGRTVQVVLSVKQGPTRIPPEWRASGHNLFYVIGGGTMPGVEMVKVQSMQVCGLKKDVWAPSKFFRDPDFAFVK